MFNSTLPARGAEGARALASAEIKRVLDLVTKAHPRKGAEKFKAIAYRPIYRQLAGSTNAALMLAQLLYWSERTTTPDGSLWKTVAQWERETGLTHSQQKTARKHLKAKGFLAEWRGGDRNKLHFWLDTEALLLALIAVIECGDSSHALSTENTEENLTQITTEARLKNAENSETKMVNRDELTQQLTLHGVGAHQIAPAIEKHAHELQRRLEFLPYVQIRKSAAAFLMNELTRPYSEPPEFSAARAHQIALDNEAIQSIVGRVARARAMA